MEKIKNILIKLWQPILIVVLLLILVQKCSNNDRLDNEKENLETEAQKNADSSKFYFNLYTSQAKKTKNHQKKVDSLKNVIAKIYLPKWVNRKKIVTVLPLSEIKDCNDTIVKIVNIAKTNDSICDKVIAEFKKENVAQDTVINSQKKEVLNLLLSDNSKTKQIVNLKDIIKVEEKKTRKEKRKNIFLKILLGIISVVAIAK